MLENIFYFFVNNGYVLEITLTTLIFAIYFPRRKWFPLRAFLCFAFSIAFSLFWNYLELGNGVFAQWIKYFAFLLIVYFSVRICWETTIWSALFITLGECMTQHLSFRISSLILALSGYDYATLFAGFVNIIISVVVYGTVFALFSKQLKDMKAKLFENKMNLFLGGIVISIVIILHIGETPFELRTKNVPLYVITSGYGIICCLTALGLQYGIFNNTKLSDNNEVLEKVVAMQKEQYQISVDNIKTINVKCHDMKHQISLMENRIDSSALEEISSIIKVYETTVNTDNELLDVFLTQKSAVCDQKNIRFDCIVNGECLQFLEPTDMYALFGNALDNAIEATEKVKDKERRNIGLSVRKQLNVVSIHVENYFEEKLEFDGDLPITSKGDTDYHGFGLKSIKMIVEKYGGNVAIIVKNNVFNLNIMIPVPEK